MEFEEKDKTKTGFVPEGLKKWYIDLMSPVIRLFEKGKVDPNVFTVISLLLSFVAAGFLWVGKLKWGGAFILIAGTFDIVDGAVARASGRVTKFGALFDSTLDRYSELAVFFGILAYFLSRGFTINHPVFIIICLAVCGSMMVSYVRARAEGLGFECKVGLMQRPERVILLGFGALFHESILIAALAIIALFANITAIQRIVHIKKVS